MKFFTKVHDLYIELSYAREQYLCFVPVWTSTTIMAFKGRKDLERNASGVYLR